MHISETPSPSDQEDLTKDLPYEILLTIFAFLALRSKSNTTVKDLLSLRFVCRRFNSIIDGVPVLWGLEMTPGELERKGSTALKEWMRLKYRAELERYRVESPSKCMALAGQLELAAERGLLDPSAYNELAALSQDQRSAMLSKLKSFLARHYWLKLIWLFTIGPFFGAVIMAFLDDNAFRAVRADNIQHDCEYYLTNQELCLWNINRKTDYAFSSSISLGASAALFVGYSALMLKDRWNYYYLKCVSSALHHFSSIAHFFSRGGVRLLDRAWAIGNLLSIVVGAVLIYQLTRMRSMDVNDVNDYIIPATNTTEPSFDYDHLEAKVNSHLQTEAYLGSIGGFCITFSSIVLLPLFYHLMKTSVQKCFQRGVSTQQLTLFSGNHVSSAGSGINTDTSSEEMTPLVTDVSPV